ncbi:MULTISPECIES: magnesium/cobalt transporter CorA [Winogradskyella]|uniref:Magnesium transport protein CorA n=1 Tax=Winogradskyella ouciana TaxID=2608631 RepID=A0A7K1GE80_9FLAO|nr:MULTISPECIES: magnesium/cobalt transporter CorA [Winogradskyella]MBO6879691.1 magnesium/cobalt transporter CorA [Winogradskyella sp.]MTE27596.1 magnesium/cobalt transporter CorA [Winogradskyella ouciana]
MLKKRNKKRTQEHKKHIGQVPGTLVYTGKKSDKDFQVECFDYTKDDIEETILLNIEDAVNYKDTDSVTWINVDGLQHTDKIEDIGKQYDLHPLVLEDIVNTTQRPKIDEYEDYLFVVLKMLYYDVNEEIVIEQVSFVLGKNYVLTFQEAEGDVFGTIRERLRYANGRIRGLKSDYLLYALIDAVVDNYFSIIETLGNKIEDLETELFTGHAREDVNIEVQQLKREILKVRRAIFPLREIINRIEKGEHPLIFKRTITYYRDIYDHLIQVSENIDIYREMIWSLMDMYMTTISNKMNEVMKVLTIMSSIFIPLSFLAGLYGMNFEYIPELKYRYGYFVLLGVMFTIFIGLLIYFKRKKWL